MSSLSFVTITSQSEVKTPNLRLSKIRDDQEEGETGCRLVREFCRVHQRENRSFCSGLLSSVTGTCLGSGTGVE